MRFLPFLLIGSICIGTLPACAILDPNDGEVYARSIGPMFMLTNKTDARIYYFAVGRETAARINWAAHFNREASVARGETMPIPHDAVHRDEGEKEAVIYWWYAVESDGERVPSDVGSIVISF